MSKVLRKIAEKDHRIESFSDETGGKRPGRLQDPCEAHDGYWLYLVPGYRWGEIHCVHEWTVKDCLLSIKEIEPCYCESCRNSSPI